MNRYIKIINNKPTFFNGKVDPIDGISESEVYAQGYRKMFIDDIYQWHPEIRHGKKCIHEYTEYGDHYIVDKMTWIDKESESEA